MGKRAIISIVSDQTIPNIEFIRTVGDENTEYFFITTDYCEKKSKVESIVKVCQLAQDSCTKISVDEKSYDDIIEKLCDLNTDKFTQILVNATGGNKPMSLAVVDHFRDKKNTNVYYTDVSDRDYFINLFDPNDKISKSNYLDPIEYLKAYGFDVNSKEPEQKYIRFSQELLEIYGQKRSDKDFMVAESLRINKFGDDEKKFLISLGFNKEDFNRKGKENIRKFANGSWFEYFCYGQMKDLAKDMNIQIGLSVLIYKQKGSERLENDLDIAFTFKNQLYVFECKYTLKDEVGGYTKMPDYIYKLIALNKQLGLTPRSILVTFDKASDLDNESVEKHQTRMKELDLYLMTRDDYAEESSLRNKLKEIMKLSK